MKTNAFKLISASTVALAFTTALALSQDRKNIEPPEAPEIPDAEAVPHPPRPPRLPDLEPVLENVRRQVHDLDEKVRQQVDFARGEATEAFNAAGDVFAQIAGADANLLRRSGPRPVRSLVIPSSEMEPQSISTAVEDLNIMARIFEKSLPGRDHDKVERRAMGIAILSPPGSTVRNFYLDGYGALFLLDVRFPLLPPPKQEEQNKPKEPTSSAWEEARNELYNQRPPRRDQGFVWKNFARGEAEEYDAQKVEDLKGSLLEAFKQATHIRAVKPEEWVTVVVTGGEPARMEVLRLGGGGGRGGGGGDAQDVRVEAKGGAAVYEVNTTGVVRRAPGQGESTLLIRARKSDVDAFDKGKLDLDQFKKKATIQVY
jgi:hypothetical protein